MENNGPRDQGDGNIHDNPAFADPDGRDDIVGTQDNAYTLSPMSPCVDKASFEAAVCVSIAKEQTALLLSWNPGLDLMGHSRVSGRGPDMGCCEHQSSEPTYVLESSSDLGQWLVVHVGQDMTFSVA